ncbi:hypothetical protein ACTXT7_013018 [Hymenolepis weldensis]
MNRHAYQTPGRLKQSPVSNKCLPNSTINNSTSQLLLPASIHCPPKVLCIHNPSILFHLC